MLENFQLCYRSKIPNAKLIVHLCDPALRAFSHITMQARKDPKRFDTIWAHNDVLQSMRLLGQYLNPDKPGNSSSTKTPGMDTIISFGEFFRQLTSYLKVFHSSEIAFVDGDGTVSNPGREFKMLEQFFGVGHELEFEFNAEKGYPCLKEPIEMCLESDKGHTRGANESINPDAVAPLEMKMIRKYYKTDMDKIFKLVHPNIDLGTFCLNYESYRFAWLSRFLCQL